jgi:hypothetical protein
MRRYRHKPPPEMTDPVIAAAGLEPAPSWPPVTHPFQVGTFGAFVALGSGWLIAASTESLKTLMPPAVMYGWFCVLVVCGSLGLVAAVTARRDVALSVLTERLALLGIAVFAVIYVGALATVQGLAGWGGIVPFSIYAAASVWRLTQVQRWVRWLVRCADLRADAETP